MLSNVLAVVFAIILVMVAFVYFDADMVTAGLLTSAASGLIVSALRH